MLRFNHDAGPAGSVSSSSPAPQSSGASSSAPAPSRRGRVRSADFGMPERQGLLDLARTYLEVQTRLWPDLVGTASEKSRWSHMRIWAKKLGQVWHGEPRRGVPDHASLFRTGSDKLDRSLRCRPNGYRRQEPANPVRP